MSSQDVALPADYTQFLADLKERGRSARVGAQRTVNTSLINLYWSIENRILTGQEGLPLRQVRGFTREKAEALARRD